MEHQKIRDFKKDLAMEVTQDALGLDTSPQAFRAYEINSKHSPTIPANNDIG